MKMKRRDKYPLLATDTEVNNCFSIYLIILRGDEAEYTFALSVYFYLLRCKAKDN